MNCEHNEPTQEQMKKITHNNKIRTLLNMKTEVMRKAIPVGINTINGWPELKYDDNTNDLLKEIDKYIDRIRNGYSEAHI